jgi:integrase
MPSFADFGEEWLRLQTHLRPRTHELYTTALRRHLVPPLGALRLDEIDEDTIAGLVADLHGRGLSGWTVRNILVPLGRILTSAVRRRLISENPMRRLERRERPQVVHREMRVLQPAEIEALLAMATPKYRTLLAVAVFTGLRQSELLGLQWQDVDLTGELLHVRRQLDRSGSYSLPKTPRALRTVVLMPSLASLLEQHRHDSAFRGPTDPVFATRTGRPMHHRNVSRRGLGVAVERAGLMTPGTPRPRFHDLRHTFASMLIAQGLTVLYVSRQLGHTSAKMTLDTYAHLFDQAEHAQHARAKLEASFGRIALPSGPLTGGSD